MIADHLVRVATRDAGRVEDEHRDHRLRHPLGLHLDEETNILFGVLWRRKDHTMADLPSTAVMQRWWAHMADVMATNGKNQKSRVAIVTGAAQGM